MANFNKVVLIGRLTRDPETRAFSNGGMVAKFGFAVTNRKKNPQGQWEDEPMFIDCEAFNRGEFGKLADIVRDRCKKGSQIMLEGRLHLDQWDDKNGGGKRSKHKIVVENVQLLDPRQDGEGGGYSGGAGGGARTAGRPAATGGRSGGGFSGGDDFDDGGDFGGGGSSSRGGSSKGGSGGGDDGDIPF